MTAKRKNYISGVHVAVATELPALRKRAHVRVPLPPSLRVFARMRDAGSTAAGVRGMVTDISAGGVALELTEGLRYELPREGQQVVAQLDYDGGEAETRGRVVRAGPRHVSLAFPAIVRDRDVNDELFALIARVVTRDVEHLDRTKFAHGLRTRLEHEHFHGGGFLDVRVAPTWWQIVFLDYVVSWSEGAPLATGMLDRSSAAGLTDDPLRAQMNIVRHDRPWSSLVKVSAVIAGRCTAAHPAHAPSFESILESLEPTSSAAPTGPLAPGSSAPSVASSVRG